MVLRAFAVLLLGLLASPGCRPPAAALEVEELLNARKYEAASARVQQALTHDPRSDALWRLRLRIYLAQGQRSEAVEAYRERALRYGEARALVRQLTLDIIVAGLSSRVPEVRTAAIQAARQTDADELEEPVAARLEDPDPVTRTWAAVALSQRPDGAEVLDRQLRSPDPRAREIAVREVGRIAGGAALTTLLRGASDPDPGVRAAAATGLGGIQREEAHQATRRLLRDPVPQVRAEAAAAAGTGRFADAAPELRELTSDPHLATRLAAVTALASLGDAEARPMLRSIAAGKDSFAALRAGLQLARAGEVQPALDAVARALVDRQWTVRAAACTTAALLHDRVGLDLLQKGLRDPEPHVRLAAARALLARPASRDAAVLAAVSIQHGSCGPAVARASAPDLCIQSADLLVRAGRGEGLDLLKQLARRGATPSLRQQALGNALLLAPNRWLALDGMADPDELVALQAASWLHVHSR